MNKVVFKKLFSCDSEEGQEGGWYIGTLIDIVDMPYLLHTENTDNFKEGLFCNTIRKLWFIRLYWVAFAMV